MKSLTLEAIHQAIDDACSETQNRELKDTSLILRRIQDCDDIEKTNQNAKDNDGLFHALVLESSSSCGGDSPTTTVCGAIYFFLAYSTWDGRVLWLDDMDVHGSHKALKSSLLYTLAEIATSLGCTRLVWQVPESNVEDCELYDSLGSETTKFLTLQMDRSSMVQVLSSSDEQEETKPARSENKFGPLTARRIHKAVNECLAKSNANLEPKKLRLVSAQQEHATTILNLVQGLANHVNHPDDVHVTETNYLEDGFTGDSPMFHCIVVEDIGDQNGDGATPVGLAFYFLAYSPANYKRFLYLEDLFLLEECRGRGGGKQLMLTLADLCTRLDCDSFVWQALEENKPALKFYDAIGAKILDGTLTLRFAGDALNDFVKSRPPSQHSS